MSLLSKIVMEKVFMIKQKKLHAKQLSQFYIDDFVEVQAAHFEQLVSDFGVDVGSDCFMVDIGGGVGLFAEKVQKKWG